VAVHLLRRILNLPVVLFFVAVAVFLLMHFVPGDPALTILGTDATAEEVEQLRELLGLNVPVHIQFLRWMGDVLRGDLGVSIITKRPVAESLLERIPVTLGLTVVATIVSLSIAIPAGVIAARNQNTWLDQLTMGWALLGMCVPSFWLGLILMLIFSVNLRWFPLTGYVPFSQDFFQALRHVALPGLSMGLVQAGVVTRMTRPTRLEVLSLDYVRTARAQGLSARVVA